MHPEIAALVTHLGQLEARRLYDLATVQYEAVIEAGRAGEPAVVLAAMRALAEDTYRRAKDAHTRPPALRS